MDAQLLTLVRTDAPSRIVAPCSMLSTTDMAESSSESLSAPQHVASYNRNVELYSDNCLLSSPPKQFHVTRIESSSRTPHDDPSAIDHKLHSSLRCCTVARTRIGHAMRYCERNMPTRDASSGKKRNESLLSNEAAAAPFTPSDSYTYHKASSNTRLLRNSSANDVLKQRCSNASISPFSIQRARSPPPYQPNRHSRTTDSFTAYVSPS
mmetsp:Transcript_32021/g.51773  ORF Transcript_32021/g.51773 Transcript_32021/m.51773 type:complete len:209 (-) Transcript_32021:928-1554(-)